MAFLDDTFTDADGTVLSSHTGETGATWTKHPTWDRNFVISDANRARCDGSADTLWYASGSPATAEYDVEALPARIVTQAGNTGGIAGRINTGAATAYIAVFENISSGRIALYKISAGSYTELGTYIHSESDASNVDLKLEIRDAAKKVYLGGTERISSANNDITAAGKAGLFGYGASSNTTGHHIDRIVGTDAAGGAAGHPAIRRFGLYPNVRHYGSRRAMVA